MPSFPIFCSSLIHGVLKALLKQMLSIRGNFAPRRHMTTSGDILVITTYGVLFTPSG